MRPDRPARAPRTAPVSRRARGLAPGALVAVVALAGLLTGCVAGPSDGPSGPPSAAPTPGAAPTSAAPVALVPGGSAADNEGFFAQTLTEAFAAGGARDGRAIVDALAAAGFDKSLMQITYDESKTGLAADSFLVSVRYGQDCLIGQVVPASGEIVHVIEPVVGDGICLLGNTRPIDW